MYGILFFGTFAVPRNALRPGRWPHDLGAFRFARTTASTPDSLDPTPQGLRVQTRGGHMALADRVQSKPAPRRHGLPCSVGDLLDKLPPDEAAALEHMLSSGWSQAEIYDAVTAEGHDIGRQTINRHRSRGCRCFK